jgi:N-methylhydantoinase B/oxoprolinase/acetone carboxylase alpha subunit
MILTELVRYAYAGQVTLLIPFHRPASRELYKLVPQRDPLENVRHHPGPLVSTNPTLTRRSSSYLIKALDPSIMVNDGSYDLMDVRIPTGCILKPLRPAALSCRTHLLGRTLDMMIGTLGQRQPKFMTAAGYSDSPHFFYSGYRKDGTWYQVRRHHDD